MTRFAFIVLICLLLTPPLYADQAHQAKLGNVGFMENPSKELQDRFQMCDAFLKVEWIDKGKRIGYTKYDASRDFGGAYEQQKRPMWALVNLDDTSPSFALNISYYKKQGKMDELADIVRNGTPARMNDLFVIKYKGARIPFYEPFYPVLNDFTQTICIPYPDEQKAWVVEGKKVEHAFDEGEQNRFAAILSTSDLKVYTAGYAASHNIKQSTDSEPVNQDWFRSLWVLDINFDGRPDFIFDWASKSAVIYSFGDKYYRMATSDVTVPATKLDFPPSHKRCELQPSPFSFFVTTDGKSFFLNNQCNLTALTSRIETGGK